MILSVWAGNLSSIRLTLTEGASDSLVIASFAINNLLNSPKRYFRVVAQAVQPGKRPQENEYGKCILYGKAAFVAMNFKCGQNFMGTQALCIEKFGNGVLFLRP